MSLIELAERCEKSTGPDREIDGIIDRLFHKRPKNGDYDETENAIWRVKDGEASGLLVRGDGFARGSFCAASYTASLDAAMSLVPEEMRDEIEITTLYKVARVGINLNHGPDGSPFYGSNESNSIPLAICAASLRARAQQEQTI